MMLCNITECVHIYSCELFLNDVKAIWLRTPKEVTDEEYAKFYQSLAKDFSEEKPLSWSHFTAEGDEEFKALLFVPPKAPHDLYESYYNSNKSNLKLFVRRVFISDEFDELLPKIAEEDPDKSSDKEKTDVEASDKDEKKDPVDEYLMQYVMEYEDKKFQNVSKEGLKLGKDSKDKEVKDTFKDLMKWWKDVLVIENVDSVKISSIWTTVIVFQ
ncbi:hypothetical protein GIB67_010116 [Kingdonia uniflora]|uniref:Uncharacterized protein n=1 Tax=Kingdonia uniflora TaxID=39325 RepID=A0A7J7NAG1_9MAGN|nr:hypothetical protein GIB67_010116 [Kingdonia uniflora]